MFAAVDRVNRKEGDAPPAGGENSDHLGLELEMAGAEIGVLKSIQVKQAETALGIGEAKAEPAGEEGAHGEVDQAPKVGDGAPGVEAVADDKAGARGLGELKKIGNARGVMLAVTVKRHDPAAAKAAGAMEASEERSALPLWSRLADNQGAGGVGADGGSVSGPIVNDNDDGQMAARRRDNFSDRGGFIEAGDDGSALIQAGDHQVT